MPLRRPLVVLDDGTVGELPPGDWVPFEDAPMDGGIYGRQNGAWVMLVPPPVPANTSLPVVSGAEFVGDTATTTAGTWTNSPTSYAYQWQAWDEVNEEWDDLVGETSNTLAAIATAGEYRVAVVATNGDGDSAPAYSEAFVIIEPPAFLTFDGPASVDAVLTSSDTQVEHSGGGTDDYATAWSNTVLSGKIYMEFEFDKGTGTDQFAQFSGDGSQYVAGDRPPMLVWETPRAGLTLLGWSLFARANYGMATGEFSGNVDTFDSPLTTLRGKVAIDTATRQFWMMTAGEAFAGDPAAGTGELFVLNGTDPILFGACADNGASVRVVPPAEHIDTPPAGFTAT